MLPVYDIFGIGAAVENFIRGLFFGMIKVLMSMISGMLDAMINGVLSFSVLDSTWVKDAYSACVLVMFIVLPTKLIYEVLFAILTDNDQALDYGKKIMGCITCVFIAIAIPTGIPMMNTLIVDCAKVVSTDVSSNEDTLGNSILASVYVGFGGMAEQGPHGARKLVETYQKDYFSIVERDADDNYVWQFSELMTIVGMVIYVVLLFVITIQIATRVCMIALLYIMGPLCCTSLTKYQDPTAFTVWKNTIVGQMAMNFAQIVSLSFMANIVGLISKIGTSSFTGLPVTMAQLALYFGSFSLVISLPSFVQAMIGGYGAGAMDIASQMQSFMHMARAGTVGLASGAIAGAIGRRSSYTGHREGGLRGAIAGNKRQDGTRTGGITGNTVGNKDKHGNRQGGIRGAVMGDVSSRGGTSVRSGGLRGAFMGSKASQTNEDGSQSVVRSGGLRGMAVGQTTATATPESSEGGTSGESSKQYQGGLRGAVMGATTVSRSGGSVTRSRSGGIVGRAKGVAQRKKTGDNITRKQATTTPRTSTRKQSSGFGSVRRRETPFEKEMREYDEKRGGRNK